MAVVRPIRVRLVAHEGFAVGIDRGEGRLRLDRVRQHPGLLVSQLGVALRACPDRGTGLRDPGARPTSSDVPKATPMVLTVRPRRRREPGTLLSRNAGAAWA